MIAYVASRGAQALLAVVGVVTLIFFLQRLTGDPVSLLVPNGASQADMDAMRVVLGLDKSLLSQYFQYMRDVAFLHFGESLVQRIPVIDIISSRLVYTLQLAAGALVVALGIGWPLGFLMALKKDLWVSRVAMGFVLGAQSMPPFWSGILMIMVFSVWLRWLPPSGAGNWMNLIMPSIALGLLSLATFARVARSAVLDELSKEYVRTARAKGISFRELVTRHLLRNSSIPIVTISAIEIAQLLAGAAIVESVFGWPGLGQLTIQSVNSRDFPVVQGIVILGAVVSVGLNLVADLAYGVIDPRIRAQRSS